MAVDILAPVDGVVVEVFVKPGERVSRDTDLFIIEKAKMTLTVRSTVPGIISELNVGPGDDVRTDFVAATISQP